ncbi:F-box/LRR-repeat protein 3 isoform X1 [Selaginella moellendorffii]|nr:F-box/LRR-repeat protein 3 isoform X1 [Selaginella moellendorffii]|eukprot:XP_002964312.2 F-box/LRR-repeat protein 3 isoform X1 [Selaginella moellendorffii]
MACSSSSGSRRPSACLLDFVDEHILLEVLGKISDSFDRRSWRMVCRTFYKLECSVRRRLQLLRAELLPQALDRYERLEELDLTCCAGVTDENLIHVADKAGKRLAAIYLNRICGFTSTGLRYLSQHCLSLVEMDLSYCSYVEDDGLLGLARLNRIEKLKLTGCIRVTDMGLESLAAGCHRLKTLVLKGCVAITDAGIKLVAARSEELMILDLSFTEVTDEGVKYVSELKALRTLNLMGCNNVGDRALSYLQENCKSLVDLDVSRCQNVSSVGIAALPTLLTLHLCHCSQVTEDAFLDFEKPNGIQTLRLDGCEFTHDSLDRVAAGCQELKELSLCKSRGVTDKRIDRLITSCKFLKKLDLTCCFDVTEISLLSIARSSTSIKSLKLESSLMVTDNSLPMVFESCHLLEELDVTDCNLTGAGLEPIGNCVLLRVLKLAFCNISDYGIFFVGAGCHKLMELDLYRCRSVGDAGVISVVNGCQDLRVLNLSYCSRISDASMTAIARLSKLSQLEIRGCTLVTSDGLTQVAAGCKRLVELDIKRCTRIGDPGLLALEHLCPDLRQINVSYCPLTNNGMMALAKLGCMQNMKLVHLKNVSMECFGNALLNCGSLKKVKLLSYVKQSLAAGVVEQLENRGCRLRCMDKPDS